MGDWASLILRVCLGLMFMAHGSQKAFGLFSGPGMEGFSKMLSGLGFAPALFWAYLGAYTELCGGLCLILGLFVRSAASLLLIFIIVAAVKVHIRKGFFLASGGFEYTFIIASICLALALLGGGKFSLTQKF
jgi:putative oxidoreductase